MSLMRTILLLLVGLISLTSGAQTVTEAQKQEALKCATEFCTLLTRFSNGERTLNTQINALCSGPDCSAFDDVKTNKEVTLRNYLFAIQSKYPTKLPMTISTPTLADSRIYIEPEVGMTMNWGSLDNNGLSTGKITELQIDEIENNYIVFNVSLSYPSLNLSAHRKLIYDVKNKKITAFIKDSGSYMYYLNAIVALIQKDYKKAIALADNAAKNSRAALSKRCYALAFVSAVYLLDFEKAVYYSELFGDKFTIVMSKISYSFYSDRFEETPSYARQLESILETNNNLDKGEIQTAYCTLGNLYAYPLFPEQNNKKALYYFNKATDYGSEQAPFLIFILSLGFGEDFVSSDIAVANLKKSAAAGYPPAFYYLASIIKDKGEARYWYEKSAQTGNYLSMACLGKLLLEAGNKSDGIKWLKESLTCENFDELIKAQAFDIWPKSRADVQTLLNKYEHSATTSSVGTSSTPNHNTTSSHAGTSSTHISSATANYSSSYNHRKEKKFNYPKDNYFMGVSAGYVRKQWVNDYGTKKEKTNIYGKEGYTEGLQAGVRVDCQFGYGFGLHSGIFYEYYFGDDLFEDMGDFNFYIKFKEHSLYLPVHFKYNLNFSRWFQIGLYGGLGLDYGMSGKYHLYSNEELYNEDSGEYYEPGEYIQSGSLYVKDNDLKRFNASLEYGASVRVRRLQINFTMAKGLINVSDSKEYTTKQNKLMSISATLCF